MPTSTSGEPEALYERMKSLSVAEHQRRMKEEKGEGKNGTSGLEMEMLLLQRED